MTRHTDEELDALVERLDNLFAMLEEDGYYTKANTADFARKAITTLRTQLAEARSELSYTNKRLEHAFERIERQARTIDDLTVRTNRAEAELAAQIEGACAVIDAHAEYDQAICCDGRECGCQGVSVHDVMKQYIRQPHDRTALDRMLAEHEVRLREAREKVLDASSEYIQQVYGSEWTFLSNPIDRERICALIEAKSKKT